MEDVLAIGFILIGLCVAVLAARFGYLKFKAYQKRKVDEAEAEQKRQIEATRKWREGLRQKQTVSGGGLAIQSGGNLSVGISSSSSRSSSYKPSYVPSVTESVRSHDSDTLSDLANLAIIANTLNHWGDHSSSSRRSDDEPVRSSSSSSSSSSSWGLDDDDSRRSAASTFSSSDSSSSWSSSSSDSWSSSDSGPSSDW